MSSPLNLGHLRTCQRCPAPLASGSLRVGKVPAPRTVTCRALQSRYAETPAAQQFLQKACAAVGGALAAALLLQPGAAFADLNRRVNASPRREEGDSITAGLARNIGLLRRAASAGLS